MARNLHALRGGVRREGLDARGEPRGEPVALGPCASGECERERGGALTHSLPNTHSRSLALSRSSSRRSQRHVQRSRDNELYYRCYALS